MISPVMRGLLAIFGAGYGVTGLVLYGAPVWASAHFAWTVSPFVAMTMGGWCLGNALAAAVILRRGRWAAMLCTIVYFALFGLFEAGVLFAFREKLNLSSPLAWLYVGTVLMTAVFAPVALAEGLRRRRQLAALGPGLGVTATILVVVFVLLVGFLGLYGLLAVAGMRGLNGGIFPEPLTMFSLRAFGAFYFALALAALPLLWFRGIGNLVHHGFAAYGLVVLITAAAVVFIDRFDIANRPTQLIYFGVYLAVGLLVGIFLLRYGSGAAMTGGASADNPPAR